ncbi:MAG: hypothetical protein AB8F34_01265 [Akkermansiaceae bacterium]
MKYSKQHPGFALIATISIMILIVMIALAMLTLSTTEIRSQQQGKAQIEAQANARLALMLAIGELQKNTGQDTRITAMADIADESYPPVLGVWRSWEGTNHDSTGRPIAPNYTIKDQPVSGGGRFLDWIVSSAANMEAPAIGDVVSLIQTTASDSTVPLVANGSLAPDDLRQIHVTPTELKGSGYFAWTVSGENQKARLAQPYEPRTNDPSGLVEMGQSHSVPDPDVFGLSSLLDDREAYNPSGAAAKPGAKAISRESIALIEAGNATEPNRKFHDFTTSAVGLLTNSATGGWRKDLSILTEKWDEIYATYPGGELPLFRYAPEEGAVSQVPKPTNSSYTPDESTLYPWSRHSQFTPKKWPNTWYAASSSWQSLANFATSYKNFSASSGVVESPFVWAPVMKWKWRGSERDATNQEFYAYNHTPRIHPVIARFQFIVYVRAIQTSTSPERYRTQLLLAPVVTLWNPYNVRLTIDNPGAPTSGVVIGGKRTFPMAFTSQRFQSYPGGPETIPLNRYKMLTPGNFQYMDTNGNFNGDGYDTDLQQNIDLYNPGGTKVNRMVDVRTWGANLPTGELVFEPGEVRMFSPNGDAEGRFGGTAFGLQEGYQPGAPAGFPVTIGNNQTPDSDFWYVLKNEVYTRPFKYREPGRGFNLSFGTNSGGSYTQGTLYSGVSQEMVSMTALTNGDRAKVYWPDEDFEPHRYTVEEIASVPAMPLYSMTLGPRFTIGTGVGTAQSRPTKGFIQNDPLAGMSLVDPGNDDQNSHPANGNFEMSYNTLSFGSSLTPNLSDRKGFIVTGFQSGDGLSRLITHQLPLRPMASIAELQAWNPRGQNPMPPYQTHLIGNSDATPMIPADDIVPSTMTPGTVAENLQHDDAYCANHLLFDDFFVSSIAPQPANLGSGSGKDIVTVYKDFLKGDALLTNRMYRPAGVDSGLSESEATQLAAGIIDSPQGDGWLKVASRLEVNGMFNVNSTSVEAWKALLGHARSKNDIAIYGSNGVDSMEPEADHPVTRGAVATDVEAGKDPAFAGGMAGASEYAGFRGLSDEQISDLAEKIVEQVRLRGPFLSLSEFINRQLSTDDGVAMAGAVQTAINNMSADPMKELRDPDNFLSDQTMHSKAEAGSRADNDRLAGVDYEFEKAAEGSSAYGVPGWIRQADVLGPIAPVLSARDDTFTIRAYGDARDSEGNITARAWCEATVRRQRDFVDNSDSADTTEPPTSEINKLYGRKYSIVSFRWLQDDEV